MQATHATRPSGLHPARPLILIGLAVTLALAAFVARAALTMAIDPSSGAAGSAPWPATPYVAGAVTTPSASAAPDPIPDPTPVSTPVPTPQPTPEAMPAATVTTTPVDQHNVIRVSIAEQRLTAYENGVAVFSTVVATGRPELPTPRGTFQIKAKYSPYTIISPWPKGDPWWYPTLTVSWAMLFADGGYFLHDSPHRTLYGPGTDVINGTHGCVNVPTAAMARLYAWAEVGTTVVIE